MNRGQKLARKMRVKIIFGFCSFYCCVIIMFLVPYSISALLILAKLSNADITNSTQKELESFEEIGVRILNALIKFGKTELTKAQVKLLHKDHPDQTKLHEQLSTDDAISNSFLQSITAKPPETRPSDWIKLGSNGNHVNMSIHRPTPHVPFKNPAEQMTRLVLDKVQKQIIPEILKKIVNERHLPISDHQHEFVSNRISPAEQQRLKHLQHEHIFHELMNEQDDVNFIQPLRSHINQLPPDKRYKQEEDEKQRPSFRLRKDTVIVNSNSEGDDEISDELENSMENNIIFKRVVARKSALARRFLL